MRCLAVTCVTCGVYRRWCQRKSHLLCRGGLEISARHDDNVIMKQVIILKRNEAAKLIIQFSNLCLKFEMLVNVQQ